MKVHVFEAPNRVFGFTTLRDGANLPQTFGPWTYWKDVEVSRGVKMIAANQEEVLDGIAAQGFHIVQHNPPKGRFSPPAA